MTIFARSPRLHLFRHAAARGLILAAGLLAGCLVLVAPAGAVVTVDSETSVTAGVQPRNKTTVLDGPFERTEPFHQKVPNPFVPIEPDEPNNFKNATGAPVLHGSAIYAIYWDPTYHYHDDWKEKVDEFMEQLGGSSNSLGDLFAVDAQYTDKSNQPAYNRVAFRGAAEDTEAYPTSENCTDPHPLTNDEALHAYPLGCLTDRQLREQLQHYIAVHALPKGMNTIYYILTPPGLTVCLDKGGPKGRCSDFEEEAGVANAESYEDSFCSYHAAINTGGLPTGDVNTVLYSVIPWTAGGLDDPQLAPVDKVQANDCQDGGFNPEAGAERQEATPGAPAVQQEPNQPSKCPSAIGDGGCDTGLADLIINQISQEQQDTVTNPLLNAWQDPSGKEVADECRNFFAPAEGTYAPNPNTGAGTLFNQEIGGGKYYLNDAFNLAALRLVYPGVPCMPGVNLLPKFTAPNPVNAGEIVSFDGMESTITLNSAFSWENGAPRANYATYRWNFGDGSPEVSGYAPGAPVCSEPWLSPCAASVFHSYVYGGEYKVTLTVTDVGGNTATITKPITVVGPQPPPPSSGPGAAGATGGAQGGATPGSASVSSAPESVPAPRATLAIVSRSLKGALGKAGLVARYSVNEQVAGRFEVLLAGTVARKLGITGPPATGLASGTPAQLVIAKAFLVTTKGGTSTVHIQLSKRTAARIHRLRKVLLMLRLSVRNAASHIPSSTTVLASATLSH